MILLVFSLLLRLANVCAHSTIHDSMKGQSHGDYCAV